MLRCALDGRRKSIRVVLIACGTPPEVLEGRLFARSVRVERVASLLAMWQERYFAAPDRVVCCPEDRLPPPLIEFLEASGYRLEWLRAADVDAIMAAWGRIRPDARWNRAGLMASLAAAAREAAPTPALTLGTVVEHWLYVWLMQQADELRAWLAANSSNGLPGEGMPDDIPF